VIMSRSTRAPARRRSEQLLVTGVGRRGDRACGALARQRGSVLINYRSTPCWPGVASDGAPSRCAARPWPPGALGPPPPARRHKLVRRTRCSPLRHRGALAPPARIHLVTRWRVDPGASATAANNAMGHLRMSWLGTE
jgi:hypothetical protein